jgi:molybdopterin molybdotransferase
VINASDATAAILASVRPLGTITSALLAAHGSALAADIVATEDIPPFDNAAMDGYALHIADTGKSGVALRLTGEIPAGSASDLTLQAGEAVAIMTGAVIPAGTGAVVQAEWTEHSGDAAIRLLRAVEPGQNVRRRGSDIRSGSTVLTAGTVLHGPQTGVLASLGNRFVAVHRKPKVGILATGNEVSPVEAEPAPAKIRNSNSYALAASVAEAGGAALLLGIAPDDPHVLREKLAEGLRHDMLLTTGGVSVGKYDLVIDALKSLGVEVKFWKVNIKPGMPLLFGMHGATAVFGLPGNPVSSLVTFSQFVRPALRKMLGARDEARMPGLTALLLHDIEKKDGKRHYVRGILESGDTALAVRSTGSQVSSILTSLTLANCLIILPEERSLFKAGERVQVELL